MKMICTKCDKEIEDDHWWEWNEHDGYFHHNCDYPKEPITEELGIVADELEKREHD